MDIMCIDEGLLRSFLRNEFNLFVLLLLYYRR